jgi:hypothetical protein
MKIDQAIIDPTRTLKAVVQALRKRLSLEDNLQCQIVDVADTGPALTPFTVLHRVGKVPRAYMANLDKHGTIRDVNRIAWTDTEMQLECSVANARLILVVF